MIYDGLLIYKKKIVSGFFRRIGSYKNQVLISFETNIFILETQLCGAFRDIIQPFCSASLFDELRFEWFKMTEIVYP